MQDLGIEGTVRASFSFYNTKEEIDAFAAGYRNGCGRCSEYIEWSNSDVVLPEEISDLPDDYRSGDLSLFL